MSQEAVATKTQPLNKRLEVFIGEWREEGRTFQSPFTPEAKVSSFQTWEWLPGEQFIIHRLSGRLGDNDIACIEIIGYNPSNQNYGVHSFYNDGSKNRWQLSERDGTWTLTGNWEKEGTTTKVRCTTIFTTGGKTMKSKWEYSSDGSGWQMFWDTELTKVS